MTAIPKVTISPSGPKFSKFVQGYWRLADWHMTPQQRLSFLQQHIELGISTVDHAHVYGSPSCEQLFGEALKLKPAVRDEIEIVSKCGIELVTQQSNNHSANRVNHYDNCAATIIASVDTSLQRLGVDYLDVLLIHRPDFLLDADEVAATFNQLKSAGKVKHLGVSNFNSAQFQLLQSRLEQPLVTNQVEINPLNFDVVSDGTLDLLQQHKILPMAWSCLAGGQLFSGASEQVKRVNTVLMQLKEELSASSLEQVIFAWILKLPSNPLPIIGSGNIERIKQAVSALELSMTAEQWYRVWVASKGHGVP